jgi:hypothetical protein
LIVLQKLSNEIAEFYRLAEQAHEWAEEATDTSVRKELHLVEQGWLILARSYEHTEALQLFTSSQQARS